MAKARLIFPLLLLLCSCAPRMEWRRHVIDGHMTGVTAVAGDDWASALGVVDSVYHSPGGADFGCGSVPVVARLLIDAQPGMAHLKEILATCPEGMEKHRPESPLSNWSVDALMLGVQTVTGRKVDVGILNMGGIRIDMPRGNVLLDDIVSMYPFKNRLCHLTLTGGDLRYIFDFMAQRGEAECVGGARFVMKDGKACGITVGGEPLSDDALYGVATIDFLLDGGDGLCVARGCRSLTISDRTLAEWMVPYVRSFGAAGLPLEGASDGRITVQ